LAVLSVALIPSAGVNAQNVLTGKMYGYSHEYISPSVVHGLSDLIVNANDYLFKDCNKVDWCWQPQGTYKNGSTNSTITYLEVVYGISVNGGKELLFADKMKVNIRPGKSIRMFSGKNNKSYVLSYFDPVASLIGPLLGSSYIDWTYEVRFLQYSDGKSVGKKINN